MKDDYLTVDRLGLCPPGKILFPYYYILQAQYSSEHMVEPAGYSGMSCAALNWAQPWGFVGMGLRPVCLFSAEPPSMRLKARPGSPGFSVLTCSAFSFYPPELQLRFLRNGLAAGSGEGDHGPNGDGSFHAWSSLTVRSGDEHHYCCLVQHAGLAQPLTVELGEGLLGDDAPYFWLLLSLCFSLLPEVDHLPPHCC